MINALDFVFKISIEKSNTLTLAIKPFKMKISVVIITFNSVRTLRKVLAAVEGWANEIVIVDSGSTDETLAIAKEFDCKIFHRKFDGFGTQKRFATDQAKNNWIFTLDSDEIVSEELKLEIDEAMKNLDCQAFIIPNTLILLGKMMKYGRESKMLRIRLFDRRFGNYNTKEVHEEVEIEGKTKTLRNRVWHDSYVDLADVFQKANKYSSLAAIEMNKRGKKTSILKIIFKFPIAFLTEYFVRLNFLNGYRGFIWAFSQAVYSTMKYMKLKEC